MARLNYLVLCESVSVDATTQKISFFNIFNQVGVDKLPERFSRFVVAFDITPDTEDIKDYKVKMRLEVVDPNDQVIGTINGFTTLDKDDPTLKEPEFSELASNVDLSDKIAVKDEGHHKIRLFIGDDKEPLGWRVLNVNKNNNEGKK